MSTRRWPGSLTCECCDGERGDTSVRDCEGCDTTVCDLCYEDYHTGGPCLTDPHAPHQAKAQIHHPNKENTMDPNETLNLLLDAIIARRIHDANDHYYDLIEWLRSGGFPPKDPRKGVPGRDPTAVPKPRGES